MIEALQTNDSELEQINKLTMKEYTRDNVFVVKLRAIDDAPTSNKRVWTTDWQKANAEKLIGVPLLQNHINDQELVTGRIFASEQTGNAIYAKAFIPTDVEIGRQTREKVQSGIYRSVSINAASENTQIKDGLTYIYPSPNDRCFEVSWVAVGGCPQCTVQVESMQESNNTITACSLPSKEHLELGQLVHDEIKAEYLRLQAVILGTSISRETYRQISESMSPLQLRAVVRDLRTVANKKIDQQPEINDQASALEMSIAQLKEMRNY